MAFIATGLYLRPRPRPGEVLTTGRVVESYRGHAYGEPAVLSVVEPHDGRPQLLRPEASGPRLDVVGDPATVSCLRADPQGTGRRTDGTARWYWLLPWCSAPGAPPWPGSA